MQKVDPPLMQDGETEFRRRLAAKLEARGFSGAELDAKIADLLRKGVALRLNLEVILVGR
jgi:hypothetical protein